MKIVFFGTGKFALPTLKKLLKNEHEVIAAVTQPDKKKGRGWNVHPTPVKAIVEQTVPGLDIFQPEKASDKEFISVIEKLDADVFVVVDYGQILDQELLDVPGKCCINLHPSLLPAYRGAAPINWAIVNGEEETGNTVIKMDERMDAGDIIIQRKTKIGKSEDAVELFERLSRAGAELVVEALDMIEKGEMSFEKQNEDLAGYAPRLKKEDGVINWKASAVEISRKVRGMLPWPTAFTTLNGKMLKILKSEAVDEGCAGLAPGTIFDIRDFIVSTGRGTLKVNMLQLEGKKVMRAQEFLKGYKLKEGTVLDPSGENNC